MTLAIAVVDEQKNIALAADSRMSGPGIADTLIKIMPLRIKVYQPYDPSEPTPQIYFDGNYGIAFAGSTLAILHIKSYLDIALGSLQYFPFYDLRFDDICDYVRSFYQSISRNLESTEWAFDTEFFLCGAEPYAPSIHKLARFQLCKEKDTGEIVAKYDVLSTGSPNVYEIGSGVEAFRRLIDSTFDDNGIFVKSVYCLRSVIEDPSICSVGGSVQFGRINAFGDFEVIGERRGELNCMLASINVNSTDISSKRGNLIMCSPFMDIGRASDHSDC